MSFFRFNVFTFRLAKDNKNKQDIPSWMKDQHTCKKHVLDSMDDESMKFYGPTMESVGTIIYNKMSATAFRVGSKYVMTVAHTVRDIVGKYILRSILKCYLFSKNHWF